MQDAFEAQAVVGIDGTRFVMHGALDRVAGCVGQ